MSYTTHEDLRTQRLRLIAITPAMLHAEQAANNTLASLIGVTIPSNWPPVDWEPHVFATLLAQFERHPEQIAWHRYITLRQPHEEHLLIGCAGAFWRETSPSECEIGYSILPPHEGKGYATEAALALINFIRGDPGITSIIAHTFPHLTGSLRVMQKCGMIPDGFGEEPGTVCYRLIL